MPLSANNPQIIASQPSKRQRIRIKFSIKKIRFKICQKPSSNEENQRQTEAEKQGVRWLPGGGRCSLSPFVLREC
jgi:hypothetical protein